MDDIDDENLPNAIGPDYRPLAQAAADGAALMGKGAQAFGCRMQALGETEAQRERASKKRVGDALPQKVMRNRREVR